VLRFNDNSYEGLNIIRFIKINNMGGNKIIDKKHFLLNKTLVIGIIILFIGMNITLPAESLSIERVSIRSQSMGYNLGDDITPPVTTIYFDPPEPDGDHDWYVSNVTITLEATDDMSGVNTTYYSINSEPWKIYDEPIRLYWDVVYHIVYFSIDNAGNIEFPKLSHLKLDQTPPYILLDWDLFKKDFRWYVNIKLEANDETSGLIMLDIHLNNVLIDSRIGPPFDIGYIIELSILKTSTLKFTYYDTAGNSAFKSINRSMIQSRSNNQNSHQFSNPLLLRLFKRFLMVKRLLSFLFI